MVSISVSQFSDCGLKTRLWPLCVMFSATVVSSSRTRSFTSIWSDQHTFSHDMTKNTIPKPPEVSTVSPMNCEKTKIEQKNKIKIRPNEYDENIKEMLLHFLNMCKEENVLLPFSCAIPTKRYVFEK